MSHLHRTLVFYCQQRSTGTQQQIAVSRNAVVQALVALPHWLEQIRCQLKSRVPIGDVRRKYVFEKFTADDKLAEEVVSLFVDNNMHQVLGQTKFDVNTFTTDQDFATLAGRRIRKHIDRLRDRSNKVANLPAFGVANHPAPSACKDHVDEETLRIRKDMLKIRQKKFEKELLSDLLGLLGKKNRTRQPKPKPENLLIACALYDFGLGVGCVSLSPKAWNDLA
ncbi:MAG: hypothetical protein WCN98_14195, partial [Verrucomicrobiaceae bacterium]